MIRQTNMNAQVFDLLIKNNILCIESRRFEIRIEIFHGHL
jgi:hypothetical protein